MTLQENTIERIDTRNKNKQIPHTLRFSFLKIEQLEKEIFKYSDQKENI